MNNILNKIKFKPYIHYVIVTSVSNFCKVCGYYKRSWIHIPK